MRKLWVCLHHAKAFRPVVGETRGRRAVPSALDNGWTSAVPGDGDGKEMKKVPGPL